MCELNKILFDVQDRKRFAIFPIKTIGNKGEQEKVPLCCHLLDFLPLLRLFLVTILHDADYMNKTNGDLIRDCFDVSELKIVAIFSVKTFEKNEVNSEKVLPKLRLFHRFI